MGAGHGKLYTYVYDAFGRLRFIKNLAGTAVIEEYTYNALNLRVGQHYDASANGSVGSEDPWLNFIYDDKWRIVATVRGSGGTNGNQTIESSPKELFVYHNAGLGGFGGSSYIDSVILVDQDNTNGLMIGGAAGASDGTLESRRYIMQNWRADVVAVTDPAGVRLESVRYSAYGVPTLIPAADFNGDGGVGSSDILDQFSAYFALTPNADVNFVGGVTTQDIFDFQTIWFAWTSGTQLGRGYQSAYGIRKGYENDGVISRFSHVRNSVYDNELGRWTRRDPIGYAGGENLYNYVNLKPLVHVDPQGTVPQVVAGCLLGGVGAGAIEYLRCRFSFDDDCVRKAGCAALGGCVTGSCLGVFPGAFCLCAAVGSVVTELCNAAYEGSEHDWVCSFISLILSTATGCLAHGAFDSNGKIDGLIQLLFGIRGAQVSGLCEPAREAFSSALVTKTQSRMSSRYYTYKSRLMTDITSQVTKSRMCGPCDRTCEMFKQNLN